MERKLLAVVAADMVGFSRLVENDETSILNRQKGISIISTIPILNDAIRIGGTESFNANLVIGKALP